MMEFYATIENLVYLMKRHGMPFDKTSCHFWNSFKEKLGIIRIFMGTKIEIHLRRRGNLHKN
jgi:hypothetical protein